MSKIRGAKRFFRIGKEDISDPYGTGASGMDSNLVTGATFDMRFFFIHEGGFSIHLTQLAEEQSVLRGQTGVLFRDKSGVSVAGDMSVLTHPDNIRWFFDMALVRDGNGELHPHTIQEFYPGIDGSEKGATYISCKASQLQAAWGTNQNKVQVTITVQGQREKAYTGTLPDVTAAGVFPSRAGYFFSNSSLIDGAALYSASWPGGTYALPLADYTEVSCTIANNLTEGPRAFHPDPDLRGAITDLIAGQERLSGNFTMQWRDLNIMTRYRAFNDLVFRNIFIHPTSVSNRTFNAVQAAQSGSIAVNYTGGDLTATFPGVSGTAPYVIAIQHGAGGASGITATQWSTAKITAVSASALTLESVDIAIAVGDRIWTEAMELRFTQVNILDLSKTGGPDDAVVTLTGNFEGKAGTGATQLLTRVPRAALPVT